MSVSRRVPLRRWLIAVTVFAATVSLMSCQGDGPAGSSSQVPAGEPAPPFSGETFAHGHYSLEDSAGRPVLINFWFPSCPPCSVELPDLQAAYEEYGGQIDFVGVQQLGLDTPDAGKAFLQERGITYPNMADESLTLQLEYGVLAFPTTVFLDRDHNIATIWSGLISKDKLEEQIESVIGS